MPRLSNALVSLAANYIKTADTADGRRRDPTGEKIATREPQLLFDAAMADGVMNDREKEIIQDTFGDNANWASRAAQDEYKDLAETYGLTDSPADSHSTGSTTASSSSSSSVGGSSGYYSSGYSSVGWGS